jgi:hypothetical protein
MQGTAFFFWSSNVRSIACGRVRWVGPGWSPRRLSEIGHFTVRRWLHWRHLPRIPNRIFSIQPLPNPSQPFLLNALVISDRHIFCCSGQRCEESAHPADSFPALKLGFEVLIQWWGGNANHTADGALANERKCSRGAINSNKVTNIQNGGIWGSMGTQLNIGPDEVSNCGDVGVDIEGGIDVTVRVGVVSNCTNGNLTTFFTAQNVTFTDGLSIQTDPNKPHFKLYNSSQDSTIAPSAKYRGVTFRTTVGIGKCTNSAGPVSFVTVEGCIFEDTSLDLGAFFSHTVHVSGNVFRFTAAAPAAFTALTVGAVTGNGCAKRVRDNVLYSEVAQPAGSIGIKSTDNTPNSAPRLYVERNDVQGTFPQSMEISWAGTNAGTRLYLFARNNTAPTLKMINTGSAQAA